MLIVPCRRGFTLVEVMLSLVLTVIVTGATYNLLFVTQRLTRVQAERVALQSGLRAGALIALNEFVELSTVPGGAPGGNDVVAMGSAAVTYRAARGFGLVCATPGSSTLQIARSSFTGHRDPQAGRDEAHVFVPGNPSSEAEDAWLPAGVVSVSTTSACPAGQGAGMTLTLSGVPSVELAEVGTPVRFTELMELRLYRADGRPWLGARSISTGEAIQPLLGPLTDSRGFELEYLDAGGTHTTDRTDIKVIRATLRAPVGGGGINAVEEVITEVAVRNSRHP